MRKHLKSISNSPKSGAHKYSVDEHNTDDLEPIEKENGRMSVSFKGVLD